MNAGPRATGLAALSVCESILLSLTEKRIIETAEARAILQDAATAHREAIPLAGDGDAMDHEGAAVLIEKIIEGGNSVRRA